MITVVSGHRRTGTSAMMKALHVGGLPAAYDKSLERPDEEGYNPNPGGLYEIGYANALSPGFLRIITDGCVVKLMWDALPLLPKGDWKVIFMHRNPEEINASCERVDEHLAKDMDIVKRQTNINKGIVGLPFSVFRPYNQDDIDHVLGILEMRHDVDIIPVQYQDLIDNPVQVFEQIKYTPLGKERLPIDVEKAAATINPDFHRVRK